MIKEYNIQIGKKFFLVAQLVKSPPAVQGTPVPSLGREDLLGKGWAAHSNFLGFPGGSDSKESACNLGDLGSTPGLGRSLEKGTLTRYSILGWRIPWTEETTRLQSMALQSWTRLSNFHFHLKKD